jgi:glycosyltransferase involved in cell wall biosynthesis
MNGLATIRNLRSPAGAWLDTGVRQMQINCLHVVPGATFGGPHNEILRLKPALARAGFEPIVVLPREPGSAADRLEALGIVILQPKMVRLRRLRSARYWLWYPVGFARDVVTLAKLIRRRRIGLVHGYGPNLQAAIAAKLTGTPAVWSLADIGAPRAMRSLIGRVLPILVDSVLLNGRAMAEAYPGIHRMDDRAVVYYPPVDVDLFDPFSGTNRASEAPVLVGALANLNPDKGLEDLIDAASILNSRQRVTFEVYGSTHATHIDYARELAVRADESIGRDFAFCGETDDVPQVISKFDIFAISSIREGTTTTAIEAMAAGLPVVSTNVGGIPEVVDDGQTGLLVEPRNPGQLAGAIERLVEDRELRLRLGRSGRARAEREFGLDRTAAAFRRAYGIAVGRRSMPFHP